MVFGRTDYERIQLNEESIWYGKPLNRNNPDALGNLEKIRELIFGGEIEQAEKLMPTALSGCPSTQRTYQTLGDLYLISDLDTEQECKEFVRELDLEQAICRVSFQLLSQPVHFLAALSELFFIDFQRFFPALQLCRFHACVL